MTARDEATCSAQAVTSAGRVLAAVAPGLAARHGTAGWEDELPGHVDQLGAAGTTSLADDLLVAGTLLGADAQDLLARAADAGLGQVAGRLARAVRVLEIAGADPCRVASLPAAVLIEALLGPPADERWLASVADFRRMLDARPERTVGPEELAEDFDRTRVAVATATPSRLTLTFTDGRQLALSSASRLAYRWSAHTTADQTRPVDYPQTVLAGLTGRVLYDVTTCDSGDVPAGEAQLAFADQCLTVAADDLHVTVFPEPSATQARVIGWQQACEALDGAVVERASRTGEPLGPKSPTTAHANIWLTDGSAVSFLADRVIGLDIRTTVDDVETLPSDEELHSMEGHRIVSAEPLGDQPNGLTITVADGRTWRLTAWGHADVVLHATLLTEGRSGREPGRRPRDETVSA